MADTNSPKTPEKDPIPVETGKDFEFKNLKQDTLKTLEEFKKELQINDPKKQKEWEKIQGEIQKNKEIITKMTRKELEDLKKDIDDDNEELSGQLVVENGELKYNEATPDTLPANPTASEVPVDLGGVMGQIPESYQKEVKNHIENNGGFAGMVMSGISKWITEIIKGIKGFFATFGIEDENEKKDKLAQINGFEDAEEERRVTASVKALKSSPVTKGPPLSDILKISHISDEDLTKILKDNPGLDFSSNKNIEAAFMGRYLPSEAVPLRHYLRIFGTLRDKRDDIISNPSQEYRAKEMFTEILAGNQNTDLDNKIPDAPVNNAPIFPGMAPNTRQPENAPTSPEVQKDMMAQAIGHDKAKNMPEGTTEEKKAKEEALKKATEFKEARKNTILEQFNNVQKRLEEKRTEQKALAAGKPLDGSEEKKRLDAVNQDIKKLEDIQKKMETEIATVMNKVGEKWEIKADIKAEDITSAEIAVLAQEKNTEVTHDQQLENTKETREKQKIIDEYNALRGELDSLKNKISITTLSDPSLLEQFSKKIQELEAFLSKNQDGIATYKLTHSGTSIPLGSADIKVFKETIEKQENILLLFQLYAAFVKDIALNNDVPDYGEKELAYFESEGGKIMIECESANTWTTAYNRGFLLSTDQVVTKLGGAEKVIQMINANKDNLKNGSFGFTIPELTKDKTPSWGGNL